MRGDGRLERGGHDHRILKRLDHPQLTVGENWEISISEFGSGEPTKVCVNSNKSLGMEPEKLAEGPESGFFPVV